MSVLANVSLPAGMGTSGSAYIRTACHISVPFVCRQVDAESSVGTKRFMDMVSFLAAFDGFALAYSAAGVLSYTSALAHKR